MSDLLHFRSPRVLTSVTVEEYRADIVLPQPPARPQSRGTRRLQQAKQFSQSSYSKQ
eukprot:m.175140 g.175140  ORF g.175140 m.175140 type:complete len:57 (+) comp21347_c0_seq7:1408-1578(+)